MTSNRVQFISPEFPSSLDVARDYDQILENNWYSNFGPFEKRFSSEIAEYIGQNVSVATVSNATTGLMLAILALLPKPTSQSNEVIMPSFTFAAGAESLVLLGYKPIFIDIHKDNLQPNAQMAERYLANNASRVVGILFCNVFGVGATNIDEWESLAERHQLPLIIDSAAGFGSRYVDGALLGARGDCEVFSFHATKPFAIGEGGAVVSTHTDVIEKIKSLSNFGFGSDKTAINIGFNAKLQELNCAIGLHQLKTIDSTVRVRQEVLGWYKEYFAAKNYKFQTNDELSSVAFVSLLAPTEEKADAFYGALIEHGIEVRRYYNPHLYEHAAIKAASALAGNLENTENICSRIISLPSHRKISKDIAKEIASHAS